MYGFIIIFHLILLPLCYILLMEPDPIEVDAHTVRCFVNLIHNHIAHTGTILYQLTDAGFSIFVNVLFIYKLQLCKLCKYSNDNNNREANTVRQTIVTVTYSLIAISVISSLIIILPGTINPSAMIYEFKGLVFLFIFIISNSENVTNTTTLPDTTKFTSIIILHNKTI